METAVQASVGLAYLCRNLNDIRALLGDGGDEATMALTKLLALLHGQQAQYERAWQDIAGLLDTVHAAVQARGDVLGVYGQGARGGISAAGVEGIEIVYRCPMNACSGRDEAEVIEFPPRCSVNGQELIRERLD